MEKKTKRGLLFGLLSLIAGGGLYAIGIVCSMSIVGLIGFVLLINGGIDTVCFLSKGISEIISFKKMWSDRERESSYTSEKYSEKTTNIERTNDINNSNKSKMVSETKHKSIFEEIEKE